MRRSADDAVDAELLIGPKIPWPAGWTSQRVIETLEPLATNERRARIDRVVNARIGSVTVLMDAPHDPHNAAAVLRTCDAFGVQELHVVPRDEEPRVGRSVAKGTEHWVDFTLHQRPELAVNALRARGFELVATHPEGALLPEDLASIPRLALLLGNERDGLSEELARSANRSVRVPMRGFVESLNVSVAAAVLLASATRARPGDLTANERALLYARGLYRSVPRAGEILAARAP